MIEITAKQLYEMYYYLENTDGEGGKYKINLFIDERGNVDSSDLTSATITFIKYEIDEGDKPFLYNRFEWKPTTDLIIKA